MYYETEHNCKCRPFFAKADSSGRSHQNCLCAGYVDRQVEPPLVFLRNGNAERIEELANLDAPDLENVQKISLPLVGSVTLSAADIKRLEPFVNFIVVEESQ